VIFTVNSLEICWNHCIATALISLSRLHLWPFSAILRGIGTWKSHSDRVGLKGGIVPHLPVHGEQLVPDSASNMRTVVMQHGDIPSEHARIVPLGGGTKIAEGSTVALYVYGDLIVLNDTLLVLFGCILHLYRWHLTLPHCFCLL
jgi:hypothetical protein